MLSTLQVSLFVLLMSVCVWQRCMLPGGGQQQHSQRRQAVSPVSTVRQQALVGHSKHWLLRTSTTTHAGSDQGPGSSAEGGPGPDKPMHDGSGRQEHKQLQQPGPLQALVSHLVLLIRAAGTLLLLAAAAPYLLSSRLGSSAAAAAASRMLPGDVQIDRISLGWFQPVALHGLAVFEGAAGSSRELLTLERISSAEPLHEVAAGRSQLTITLTNPSIDCSLTDTGDNFRLVKYLEESRLLGLLTGRHRAAAGAAKAGASAAAAAAAKQHVAAGAATAKVSSHPIEVSAESAEEDEKAAAAAAASSGAGAAAAAAPVAAAGAPAGTQHGPSAAAKAVEKQAPAPPAAKADHKSSSSSSKKHQQPAVQPAAAPAAAVALPPNIIQRLAQADSCSHLSAELRLPRLSVYIPDGKLLMPQELGAAMGTHIHAVAAAGTSAVQELAEELEEDCSWAQQQQQQPHVHDEGASEAAPEQQQQQQQQQHEAQQKQQQQQEVHRPGQHQHSKSLQQQADGQQGGSKSAAAAAATREIEPWPIPPLDLSKKAWAHATPLMLQLSGDRVSALVRGWHMGSVWRLSKSSLLLLQPATATWEFTPELAALTLSQFNPLLEEVALIRESGQLITAVAPAGGRIPAKSGQLHVAPVKLVVGKGNLLSQIYRLLGLHGRFGSSGSSHQQPWLQGGSSGSTTAAAAADKEAAAAMADDGSTVRGVEVWSGPLRVTIEGPGRFRTDRVDMLIGSGRNSLHVALWGTIDTNSNTLAMTVGLPATTLAKAGLRGLPPGYLLPVAVSGPLHRPQVEWSAAVRQLAVLSAMQLGREAWQAEGERVAGALIGAATRDEGVPGVAAGLTGLLGAANRALSKATSSFIGQVDERLQNVLQNVPPPAALPWEQR